MLAVCSDLTLDVCAAEALVDAGVSHVVLAVSYRAEQMEQELRQEAEKVRVTHRGWLS